VKCHIGERALKITTVFLSLLFRMVRPSSGKFNTELLAQEAVRNPKFLAYVFRALDMDGDGIITPVEINEALSEEA
jgi:hypothetical protein